MPLPHPSRTGAALVTGASSGIGAELARQFAARGHHVILVARREAPLQAAAADITARGGSVSVIAIDLADPAARAGLPERVAALGRRVGILVNNAGVATTGAISASDTAAELRVVEVDVTAVLDLTTRFLPDMVARGSGAVLNVASTGAFQPLPGQASYGAAKAFVLSYTRSLAAELAGSGVVATVLCPGPVATGFGERAGFPADAAAASLPKAMWLSPARVAGFGIEALDRGRTVAIPGWLNRTLAVVSHLVPSGLLAAAVAKSHPGLNPSDGKGPGR